MSDDVLGLLVWQGYGDGDWWSVPVATAYGPVELRLEGFHAPYPELVARARVLAGTMDTLQELVAELVRSASARHPDRAAELTRLCLEAVVVFRPDPEDPDGYAGEFLTLTDPEGDAGEEWRADLTGAGLQRLRPWS